MKGHTMILKCYIDEHGIRRAEVSSLYELLGWYLEGDVQASIYHCKLLFSEIKKVKTYVKEEFSGTGNAHTITITRDKVIIENEFLIESEDCGASRICEMSLNEFEKALTQWFEFILIGQEDQLEWVEKMMMREAKLPRIREQRIKRKLMASNKIKSL